MKYEQKSFEVGGYSKEYGDGWDRIFQKKDKPEVSQTGDMLDDPFDFNSVGPSFHDGFDDGFREGIESAALALALRAELYDVPSGMSVAASQWFRRVRDDYVSIGQAMLDSLKP